MEAFNFILNKVFNDLINKTKAFQEKVDACYKNGGHYYRVHGFSKIAHPETIIKEYPDIKNMEDIKFSSYYCTNCRHRVSVEEGRKLKIHNDYIEKAIKFSEDLRKCGEEI